MTEPKKRSKTVFKPNPVVAAEDAINSIEDIWGDPHEPKRRAIEPETARLKAGLNWLAKKAHRGDKIAFQRLVTVVSHATTAVRALTTVQFETAREIAQRQICWPVNITDNENHPEDLNVLRKRLEIGSNYPAGFNLQVPLDHKSTTGCREIVCYCLLTLQAARFFELKKKETIRFLQLSKTVEERLSTQRMSPAERREEEVNAAACRALANKLHREIKPLARTTGNHLTAVKKLLAVGSSITREEKLVVPVLNAAANLPNLSLDEKMTWNTAVRSLLSALTGDAPEHNPVLAKIGSYRAKKYFRDLGIPEPEIGVYLANGRATRTVYSNIRDGLFTKVSAMIHSLLTRSGPEAEVPPSNETE